MLIIIRLGIFVVLCCSLCNSETSQNDLCDKNEIAKHSDVDEIAIDSSDIFKRDERDVFRRVKREFGPYKSGKTVARQVSNALDHLLFFSGYDKRIRPQVIKSALNRRKT